MKSSCDNHPFDRAVDVCPSCYLSICDACAVRLKGRKHLYCKSCALVMSGTARRTKGLRKGDRSTAKERRKLFTELATAGHGKAFTYFDEETGGQEPVGAVAAKAKRKDRAKSAEPTEARPDPGVQHSTEPPVPPSAATRLAELKNQQHPVPATDASAHREVEDEDDNTSDEVLSRLREIMGPDET